MKNISIFFGSILWGLVFGYLLKMLWGGAILTIFGFIFIWCVLVIILSCMFGGSENE